MSVQDDTDNMEEEEQEGSDNMEEEEQEGSKKTSSNRTKNYKDILHGLRRNPDYIILDFGKYKDTVMQDVPFSYMIFLTGYKMRETGTRIIPGTTDAYRFVKDKRPQVRRFATAYLKNHDDWNTRHQNKKCWKLLKNDQERFSDHQEE